MKSRDQLHAAAMTLLDANGCKDRKIIADRAFLDTVDEVLEAFEASLRQDVAWYRPLRDSTTEPRLPRDAESGSPVGWGDDVDNSADPPVKP